MGLFSYVGLDARGLEQKGQLEAASEKELARLLRERSVFLLTAREGKASGPGAGLGAQIREAAGFLLPSHYAPVGAGDLVVFFRQIALMLRAGYTLVATLEATGEMVAKHRLRRAIKKISDEIRRGASFSSMLAGENKIFSPVVSNLIASGEKSGNLDTILDRLAESLERGRELKRQLITALAYPGFVLLASIGVVVFLVVGVIPRFATFLTAKQTALPASTQVLMDISAWALLWGRQVGIVLGIGIFGVFAAYTTRRGKRVVDRCILAVPVVGNAILFAAMAQAGWSMSMLLKSGVTALEALRITGGVVTNLAVGDCFTGAAAWCSCSSHPSTK
jgi:type II secretory pathway component PulF